MSELQPDPGTSSFAGENHTGTARLVYILYLAGFFTLCITTLAGVVIAYLKKDEVPENIQTHYHNQINIFWKSFLYSLVAFLLTTILIGYLLFLPVFVWVLMRIVRGMDSLSKGEPVTNPAGWGFKGTGP